MLVLHPTSLPLKDSCYVWGQSWLHNRPYLTNNNNKIQWDTITHLIMCPKFIFNWQYQRYESIIEIKLWQLLTSAGRNQTSTTTLKNNLAVSGKLNIHLLYESIVSLLGNGNLEIWKCMLTRDGSVVRSTCCSSEDLSSVSSIHIKQLTTVYKSNS